MMYATTPLLQEFSSRWVVMYTQDFKKEKKKKGTVIIYVLYGCGPCWIDGNVICGKCEAPVS